jgi:adenylate kinase
MYLVLLGAPGSGKGTQAKLLSEKLAIPQISTGDLFRQEMAAQTDLGESIRETMKSGNLVDDETTMKVFKKRLSQKDCQSGAILDGIPRTLKQAEMLEELFEQLEISLDFALYIDLPEDEIMRRITGRWTCKEQGHVYHEVYNPPKNPGICDIDSSELFQREDQQPKVVKERIAVYKKNTEPLVSFYYEKDLLLTVNGEQSIEDVHQEIMEKLDL